ncbi:MAG: bacterial Ig-like protein, partial [Paenibacillus sp.]|nr:bacterial Ig-like protein [Paenibacillus sp.]
CIYADSDDARNAVYEIAGVRHEGGNRYTLDIGDLSPIRSYADSEDAGEFLYDLREGAEFYIPLSYFHEERLEADVAWNGS